MKRKLGVFFLTLCIALSIPPATAFVKGTEVSAEESENQKNVTGADSSDKGTAFKPSTTPSGNEAKPSQETGGTNDGDKTSGEATGSDGGNNTHSEAAGPDSDDKPSGDASGSNGGSNTSGGSSGSNNSSTSDSSSGSNGGSTSGSSSGSNGGSTSGGSSGSDGGSTSSGSSGSNDKNKPSDQTTSTGKPAESNKTSNSSHENNASDKTGDTKEVINNLSETESTEEKTPPQEETEIPKMEEESSDNTQTHQEEETSEGETAPPETETSTSETEVKTDTPADTGTEQSGEVTASEKKGAKAAAEIILNKEKRKTFFGEYSWVLILIKILFVAVLTYLASYASKRMWLRNPKNNTLLFHRFIYNIIQVLIYLIGGLCAISQIPMLSKVTQTVLAGSGIFALGISLAAQESLKSILSGLFITIFKPFEVGDRVTLVNNKITGNVEDITLRHTIIKTFTNTRIIVPNSTINSEIIENSNIVDSRASSYIDVWVAYESDIDLAKNIMGDVIGNHPLYLDVREENEKTWKPKVTVYVRELGNSGIALRASMWTKTVSENFDACSEVRLQIKKAFDEYGIEIPYTKYTILQQKE